MIEFSLWFLLELNNTCHLTISSCVSVRMSRYWARGKFGEHERGVRVARGAAECNSSLLSNRTRAPHTFWTFLCRCFAPLQRETSRNFLVTCFMEKMLYVFLFTYFWLSFSPWWLQAFLICTAAIKFHAFVPTKLVSVFLISRSSSFSVFDVNVDIKI